MVDNEKINHSIAIAWVSDSDTQKKTGNIIIIIKTKIDRYDLTVSVRLTLSAFFYIIWMVWRSAKVKQWLFVDIRWYCINSTDVVTLVLYDPCCLPLSEWLDEWMDVEDQCIIKQTIITIITTNFTLTGLKSKLVPRQAAVNEEGGRSYLYIIIRQSHITADNTRNLTVVAIVPGPDNNIVIFD